MPRYIGATPAYKVVSYSTTGSPTVTTSGSKIELAYLGFAGIGTFIPLIAVILGMSFLREVLCSSGTNASTKAYGVVPGTISALLIGAGGGGASGSSTQVGGGGGAGDNILSDFNVVLGATYTITPGVGGIKSTTPQAGGYSSIKFPDGSYIYAMGGGRGIAGDGANGGGGCNTTITNRSTGGIGIGLNYAGLVPANGGSGAATTNAGGGGGAGGTGSNGSSTTGGAGGGGVSITGYIGSALNVCAGGGGGGTVTGGAGGTVSSTTIGGVGAASSATAGSPTAYTGSGGGGAGLNGTGSAGADGAIYLYL